MPMPIIAVVAYQRISPFHLAVPCNVFGEDRRDAGVDNFELRVCGLEGSELQTSGGFGLTGLRGLDALDGADLVIVPGWRDPLEIPPAELLTALQRAAGRGAILVGLCLGSYVLAAAGLLDGRAATTHWLWADDLARRYPHIRVDRNVLYLDEGQVVTSAGVAAGIDCCLHLLRRLRGAEAAARVARRMVVPPHRQGGQAQYIEQPLLPDGLPERFAGLLEWLQARLAQPHSLDSLAARLHMSRRTFTRHFHKHTGTTVGAWLLNQRLALAQRLLETSDASLARIAEQTGFGSEINLRQQFGKALQTTPSRYRKEFRNQRVGSLAEPAKAETAGS